MELTVTFTVINGEYHQGHLKVEQNDVYMVPRAGTVHLVSLLNNDNLRWFFIDLKGNKTRGTAAYARFLADHLDQVNELVFLVAKESVHFC